MKKLILAALIIGAFSACTKSSVQYEQPGEISIRPVAAKATKAVYGAVDGTEYPEGENFNVWAWWGNVPAGTELDAFPAYPDIYIHDGTFEYSYDAWRGYTPYYWPTEGSLVFAGYSPASAYKDALLFNYRWTEKIFEIRGYKQSTDISATNDLMWFDATVRSYSDNGTYGVPVVFHHILSWLTFTFQLKEGVQSSHTVTNVKLTGIETEARFTSKPAAGNPEWTDHYLTDEVQIWSVQQGLSSTLKPLESTPVTLESTPGGVLVIPQSCANEDAQLEITYYVGDNSSDLKTKILYLTYFTEGEDGNVNNVWEPGKHYIYNIIFSADNEILVMPEVDDWITETVDIEIQ